VLCLTGSRCILSAYLNLDGTAVNDSHAEVIARRAFIKYDFLMLFQLLVTEGKNDVYACVMAFSVFISSVQAGIVRSLQRVLLHTTGMACAYEMTSLMSTNNAIALVL